MQVAANYLLFCIHISLFFDSLPEFLLLFSLTPLLLFLRGAKETQTKGFRLKANQQRELG